MQPVSVKMESMKIWFGVLLVLISGCALLQAQPPVHKPLVWSVKAGNPTIFEKPRDWSGHLSVVTFSPDGTTLATGGGSWGRGNTPQEGSVWLWNAQSGAPQGELSGHKDIVQGLAFSPDGRLLAAQSQDGALFLWDVKTRTLRHRLATGYAANKKPDLAQSLAQPRLVLGAWSPDSKTLATYEWKFDVESKPPNYAHSIQLFDANTGQLIRSFTPRPRMLTKMAWTGDGKNLIISTQTIKEGKPEESAVETIDGQSGVVLRRLAVNRGVYQSVAAFSPDSRYALVSFRNETNGEAPATQTVHLWDLQDDRAVWTKTVPKDALQPAAFTRDGKTLVADNGDGSIGFYDALTGMAQRELPSSSCNDLESLALAPNAHRVAFVEQAMGGVYMWNMEAPIPVPRFASQTVLHELHNVRALQWRGDEVHVITEIGDWKNDLRMGEEIRIETWNAATGQIKKRVIAEKRLMSDAALSPDGALLAVELGTQPEPVLFKSAGIGLYDLQAGKLLRLLPEKYGLSGLAWSPDGKTLATSVHEGDVTLWNAQTGEKQRVLRTEAISIAWSPDGKTLAAGGADGIVQFFNSQTGREEDEWQVKGAVRRLAWSPDGKKLALGVSMQEQNQAGPSTVRVWDVERGREISALSAARVLQHLHWTPDSSAIAVSGRADINRADKGQLRVWNAANGAELIALDERCGLEDFAFSPDGTRLVAHAWNRLRVWQLK